MRACVPIPLEIIRGRCARGIGEEELHECALTHLDDIRHFNAPDNYLLLISTCDKAPDNYLVCL